MSDQGPQNSRNDFVQEFEASRGLQAMDANGTSNANENETSSSPWKYQAFNTKKKSTSECSHKVIEKRRRDRINKCLADLGQIVPTSQTGKQGSGKLEKAEILELTVEYIKNLQATANNVEPAVTSGNGNSDDQKNPEKEQQSCTVRELQSYSKGYSDCTSEVLHFLVTVEATDPRLPCFQRLKAHLRNRCRHLIDIPDHDNRQKNKKTASSNGKTNVTGKKNLKREPQNNPPSEKKPRIEEDSPVSGNDKPKPLLNTTVMGLLEENVNIAYKKGHSSVGSSSMSSSNGNSNSDSINGNNSGNNDMIGNNNNFTAQYQNNNAMPFPNHFYPPSYGFPTYALHPAGTHYIPVALHPGIQMPGNSMNGMLPAASLITPGLGYYGSQMSGTTHSPSMGGSSPASYPPLGGFSMGAGLGGMVNGLGAMGLGLGGLPSSLAGPGGLPVYLSMAQKEQNSNRGQDSNGSSENESNSSSDEYTFSSSSSNNLSEIGIQTDQQQDHSDYFSAGSR